MFLLVIQKIRKHQLPYGSTEEDRKQPRARLLLKRLAAMLQWRGVLSEADCRGLNKL